MKTRFLIFALALIAMTVIAACAPVAAPPPATSAPAAQPTAAPAAEQFRVAVVMPSAANDLAFSQSMVDALNRLQSEMGKDKFDFVYSENMFVVGDAAAAIRDYATKGYNLVIAHGSQYGAPLQEIAPDFPDTAFAWGTAVDTFEDKGIKNVFAYTVASDQGGYVEGVMAAKLSKSKVLGALGPIPAGDGQLTIRGFEAGALATDPAIKVQTTYTNSFSDVALMSQAAQTQIASGADVLTGTSQSVVGAVSVIKDKNALWFGNQSDQSSLAPGNVVASQVYDWTFALKDMMSQINAGTRGGEVFIMTFANGGLVMQFNDGYALPADIKTLAEQTIAGLKDGSIKTGIE
ncbi:MAG: BMP family protein [Anaerolineae bacterium]|nr:BMP family protein [Anaerolineae bacterium]